MPVLQLLQLFLLNPTWSWFHVPCKRGFPGGASGKDPTCQYRTHKRCWFHPWVRKVPWRRTWNPLQYSCLKDPMDREAWRATVHRVAKSQTRRKQLSTHTQCKMWIQLIFSPNGESVVQASLIILHLTLHVISYKSVFHRYMYLSFDMYMNCTCINFCSICYVASVVFDSVWPHRWQPTRLPRPWDSPGKNTGVGCHCLPFTCSFYSPILNYFDYCRFMYLDI